MAAKGTQRAKELRSSISEATERIDEIIAVAEQAAERARAEASAQGERYLSERRKEADRAATEHAAELREVTQEIIQRSEQVGRTAEALGDELREVLPKLRALTGDRGGGAEAPLRGKPDPDDADSGPRQPKQEQ